MKAWQWISLCVVGFLVFLIAYAPATLIYRFLPQDLNVVISQPTGTLFKGKMSTVGYNGILFDNFTWKLSPFSLLLGKVKLDINGGNIRNDNLAYVDGVLAVSLFNTSHLTASDLTLLMPIKSVLAQVKVPVQISAQGRIRVDLVEADVKSQCQQLDGTGSWNNASIVLNQQSVQLGSFQANLSCEGDGFAALVGGDNKFNLDAKFVLSPQGRLSQSGSFMLDPSLPQPMQQAAVFFGNPDPNGRYILR